MSGSCVYDSHRIWPATRAQESLVLGRALQHRRYPVHDTYVSGHAEPYRWYPLLPAPSVSVRPAWQGPIVASHGPAMSAGVDYLYHKYHTCVDRSGVPVGDARIPSSACAARGRFLRLQYNRIVAHWEGQLRF